jgi:hypothetical protein
MVDIIRFLTGNFMLDAPFRSKGIGRRLEVFALFYWLSGIAVFTLGVVWLSIDIRRKEQLWLILIDVIEVLVGLGLSARGNQFWRAATRHFVPIVTSPRDLHSKLFTLYLRSFRYDAQLAKVQRLSLPSAAVRSYLGIGRTEEELLALALAPVGPVVTVRIPGEPVPHIGAERVYLEHDDWQKQVRELMLRARLVVIALGASEGTLWELAEAVSILPPERIILVVPMMEQEYEGVRKKAADRLRARAEQVWRDTGKRWLPPELPAYVGRREIRSTIQGLIYFSSNWEPVFMRLRSPKLIDGSLRTAIERAMWPIAAQLSAYEHRSSAPSRGGSMSSRSFAAPSHRPSGSMSQIERLRMTGAVNNIAGGAIFFILLARGVAGPPWSWNELPLDLCIIVLASLNFIRGLRLNSQPRWHLPAPPSLQHDYDNGK